MPSRKFPTAELLDETSEHEQAKNLQWSDGVVNIELPRDTDGNIHLVYHTKKGKEMNCIVREDLVKQGSDTSDPQLPLQDEKTGKVFAVGFQRLIDTVVDVNPNVQTHKKDKWAQRADAMDSTTDRAARHDNASVDTQAQEALEEQIEEAGYNEASDTEVLPPRSKAKRAAKKTGDVLTGVANAVTDTLYKGRTIELDDTEGKQKRRPKDKWAKKAAKLEKITDTDAATENAAREAVELQKLRQKIADSEYDTATETGAMPQSKLRKGVEVVGEAMTDTADAVTGILQRGDTGSLSKMSGTHWQNEYNNVKRVGDKTADKQIDATIDKYNRQADLEEQARVDQEIVDSKFDEKSVERKLRKQQKGPWWKRMLGIKNK